ncbi:MAG: AtpZ/AtpI family protein [Chloracidobacterium sp.]
MWVRIPCPPPPFPNVTYIMRPSHDSEPEAAGTPAQMLASAGLALGLPLTLIAPFMVGYWLDRQLQTSPLWFTVLGLSGLVSSGRLLYRLWRQFR